MSTFFADSEDATRGVLLPRVFVPSPHKRTSAEESEKTVSYATTQSQGMSHLGSQISSQEVSYSHDAMYIDEMTMTGLNAVPSPGCQERDVEKSIRPLQQCGPEMTMQERNTMMRELADFICEVPQS